MNTEFVCTPGGDAFEVKVASSGNTHPQEWFFEWATGGNRSDSGVSVNGYTALTHCPIWQGINIIAGDIGQTPVRLVRNKFNDQKTHAAWKLLRLKPNGLQTPSAFLETLIQWALMWGQGVSWIQRRGAAPDRLVPLRPDCLWKELVAFEESEVLLYHYYSPLNGKQYVFFPDEVIDIPGLTSDGVCGYELHQIAKNTIGHGLALEKHGNSTFANGAVPSGVLEAPTGNGISRDKEARKNLRREWDEVHRGPDKAGAIAILWEGITYKATSTTNIDAQWIEAKKIGRYEAASLLNLPPHKLGAMEDSSVRANLEEQNADYAQRTLTRWYNRMSEEFRRKLLTEKEWLSDEFQFVWDVEAFLKADIDTMTTVLDRLVKATILNPNEAREKIGLPPYPGGEKYGSPAINPRANEGGDPDKPKTPPQAPQKRESEVSAAHRDAISALVAQSLKMEAKLLRQAAEGKLSREQSGARNFIEWLDEFYLGNGAPSKMMSAFDSIVGKSLKAAQSAGVGIDNLPGTVHLWALERRKTILDACSHVTAKELPAAIEPLACSSHNDAAESIMRTAMGEPTETN